MILGVFTVFDSAARAFMQPFFVRSKGEAIRSFTDAVNDEKGPFRRHVADYALFELGEYEDGSGGFVMLKMPVRVVTAVEVLAVDDVFPPDRKIS